MATDIILDQHTVDFKDTREVRLFDRSGNVIFNLHRDGKLNLGLESVNDGRLEVMSKEGDSVTLVNGLLLLKKKGDKNFEGVQMSSDHLHMSSNGKLEVSIKRGLVHAQRISAKKIWGPEVSTSNLEVGGNKGESTFPGNVKIYPKHDKNGQPQSIELDGGSGTIFCQELVLRKNNKDISLSDILSSSASSEITLFKSGTSNPPKMVIKHSEAHDKWGLEYRDNNDSFNFKSQGADPILNIGLSNRKVGINTDTPQEALHVKGNIALTGDVLKLSDVRHKHQVTPLDNCTSILKALNPVSFLWKTGKQDKQLGFIAQEVQHALPEAVVKDAQDNHHINYDALIPILIGTVKKQQEQIESLLLKI